MKEAVKTSFGSYRIVDGDGTHIIMTNEDFHENTKIFHFLRDDIRRLSQESVDLHCKLQDDLKTIEFLKSELAVAEGTIKELSEQKDDLERSISSLKDELAKLTDDLAHAESLNVNLKRICRERANQARDLPKSSDGYIVLVSQEWREKAQNGKLIRGYKSVIQSPYDAAMDDTTAKKQIFEDLINGVLTDLGCPYYEQVNGRPKEPIEEMSMSMYRWVFTADFRSTFWNITIYTSGPLKVPPHRRPQQKPRNQGGTSK
ncbi:MAG: hypothetical protein IJ198_13785 [Lachnospiraceae bacterium]|nr:hypothetical protein [Lachnospiraceae bacterium]